MRSPKSSLHLALAGVLTAGVALFHGFSKIAIAIGGLPNSLPVSEVPTPDFP